MPIASGCSGKGSAGHSSTVIPGSRSPPGDSGPPLAGTRQISRAGGCSTSAAELEDSPKSRWRPAPTSLRWTTRTQWMSVRRISAIIRICTSFRGISIQCHSHRPVLLLYTHSEFCSTRLTSAGHSLHYLPWSSLEDDSVWIFMRNPGRAFFYQNIGSVLLQRAFQERGFLWLYSSLYRRSCL